MIRKGLLEVGTDPPDLSRRALASPSIVQLYAHRSFKREAEEAYGGYARQALLRLFVVTLDALCNAASGQRRSRYATWHVKSPGNPRFHIAWLGSHPSNSCLMYQFPEVMALSRR